MNRYYESPEITKNYFHFRPKYTQDIADYVIKYCKNQQQQQQQSRQLASMFDLMVDVGCGSGQSSNLFQRYFKRIIAIDVSKEQIKQAKDQNIHENITYMEGNAQNIPVRDQSVDLVIAGAAAHWFDFPKFFEEVERVLKPSGCLAMFSYNSPRLKFLLQYDDESVTKHLSRLLENTIFGFVPENKEKQLPYQNVLSRYADIFEAIPFPNKQRNDSFYMTIENSINDLSGLIRSVDSYESFMQNKLESFRANNVAITDSLITSIDPVVKFVEKLENILKTKKKLSKEEKTFETNYNFFVLVAKP